MLKLLTNKHVVIAMIVAPVLAVLAWIAVGQFAGEQAAPAQAGREYPLVEQSNCRYASGACDLTNEEFKLRLSLDRSGDPVLNLSASHPLDGVLISVGAVDDNSPPAQMRATGGQGTGWSMLLGRVPDAGERVRLVAVAGGSAYFAEASTQFMVEESVGQ